MARQVTTCGRETQCKLHSRTVADAVIVVGSGRSFAPRASAPGETIIADICPPKLELWLVLGAVWSLGLD